MIISELSSYMRDVQRAALGDLSVHFESEPDALRGMLNVLERKGRVRKLPAGSSCGSSCCKCDSTQAEIYEWVN